MKSYIKIYIEADWTAAEALTELAKRLDANSGAGLVTADEHDALITITESGCNWQAEIKTKDAEAADLRRKLAQARDEAARLAEMLADMNNSEIGKLVADFYRPNHESIKLMVLSDGNVLMSGGAYGEHPLGKEKDVERILAHFDGYLSANGLILNEEARATYKNRLLIILSTEGK